MLLKQEHEHLNILQYSTVSEFDDDIWILDSLSKGRGTTSNKSRLSFKQVPTVYALEVKQYILERLNAGRAVTTIKRNLQGISLFLRWLDVNSFTLNKSVILEYELYLKSTNSSLGTKEARWEALHDYLGDSYIGNLNPFRRSEQYRRKQSKYIPKENIIKIDKLFKSNELPHYIKTVYWILRLIPSRIGEVTSLPIDCVEEQQDLYILTLNMYKQNGGHIQPQKRNIYLLKDETSNYLINLIRKQQEVSQSLQEYIPLKDRGYLFTYLHTYYINGSYVEQKACQRFVSVINEDVFAAFLKKIPARYGSEYKFTSHQLRHNAISDRLSYGFTPQQIQLMSAHKTTKMIIDSYAHYTQDDVIDKFKEINNIEQKFHGRIINDTLETLLLKRNNTELLQGLGICSDINNCQGEKIINEKRHT